TASILTNGKILVTGGTGNSSALNSTEVYDPLTSAWTITSNMNNARDWHTASVLSNGRVLVAGGGNGNVLNSAELYDPLANTWTTTSNMTNARSQHTASVLSNGKVLATGGYNGNTGFLNSAELY
ncbi:unnamed protein product, partial [Adineta steineri]